jgi:MFS superfamily sulfate permease-like transporter
MRAEVRGWRAAFPPAQWLAAYRPQWLAHDAIAGVTLAAYGIPVSLAYASLAGLPIARRPGSMRIGLRVTSIGSRRRARLASIVPVAFWAHITRALADCVVMTRDIFAEAIG